MSEAQTLSDDVSSGGKHVVGDYCDVELRAMCQALNILSKISLRTYFFSKYSCYEQQLLQIYVQAHWHCKLQKSVLGHNLTFLSCVGPL